MWVFWEVWKIDKEIIPRDINAIAFIFIGDSPLF